MTNGDRIRAMTDKELAHFLCYISDCREGLCPAYEYCRIGHTGTLSWVKMESEDADE